MHDHETVWDSAGLASRINQIAAGSGWSPEKVERRVAAARRRMREVVGSSGPLRSPEGFAVRLVATMTNEEVDSILDRLDRPTEVDHRKVEKALAETQDLREHYRRAREAARNQRESTGDDVNSKRFSERRDGKSFDADSVREARARILGAAHTDLPPKIAARCREKESE